MIENCSILPPILNFQKQLNIFPSGLIQIKIFPTVFNNMIVIRFEAQNPFATISQFRMDQLLVIDTKIKYLGLKAYQS